MILTLTFLVSANNIYYPGETENFTNEFNITNLVYTVVGNSTIIPELDMKITIENITITFPDDMEPDNFKLVFIKNNTKEIEKIVYVDNGNSCGSSGGTSIRYIDRNVTIKEKEYINISVPGETLYLEKNNTIDDTDKKPFNFKYYKAYLYIGLILLLIFIVIYVTFMLINRENDYDTDNEGVVYDGE